MIVNTKALRELADAVEDSTTFDQSRETHKGDATPYSTHTTCTTPGCIAGHAGFLWPHLLDRHVSWRCLLEGATGLSHEVSEYVFAPYWGNEGGYVYWTGGLSSTLGVPESDIPIPSEPEDPTREDAATLLRFLADHYDRVQGGAR